MKLNGKMSEYKTLYKKFKHWNFIHENRIYSIMFVVALLFGIISCMLIHNIFGHEVENYSVSNYEYLITVVDNIWDENTHSLNIANIPDDVNITDVEISKEGTSFWCFLETDNIVVGHPSIFVHISDNFDVETTYPTENEYVKSARRDFFISYFLFFMLSVVTVSVVWFCVKTLIYIFCLIYDLIKKFI